MKRFSAIGSSWGIRAFMVGFLALVIATLTVVFDSEAASVQDKVVISHSGMNARYAHLWIAQERGFFARQGLDTDVIFVRSGRVQVASVASGDVQIGYAPGVTVLGAAAEGARLKIIAGFNNHITHDLVGRPGMKSMEDLRRKRFGIQSIGDLCGCRRCLDWKSLGWTRCEMTSRFSSSVIRRF